MINLHFLALFKIYMLKVNSSFQITEKLTLKTRQLSEFIKFFHETILQLNFIPIQNVINFDYHIV